MHYVLTLLLLKCLFLVFIDFKLDFLTQFPAANDEKNSIYKKFTHPRVNYLPIKVDNSQIELRGGIDFFMSFYRTTIAGYNISPLF